METDQNRHETLCMCFSGNNFYFAKVIKFVG